MTWLQLVVLAGVMATFMGAGIAVAAYFNGKYIKEGVKEIKELVNGIRDLIAEINKTSEQRHSEVVELLKKGFGDLSMN